MNGILLIDKPEGMTSAEVVRRVKRAVGVKVGHLGTLDPFATGLLPLCLGEATKIAQFLAVADKRYEGIIRLGSATDTGDRTGRTIRTAPIPDLAGLDLTALASQFIGEQQQIPPMYSALKREGVPLYRLARQGVEVARAPRPVRIDNLLLSAAGPGSLRFSLACSKGTYVRVLGEDIGAVLGSAAHLDALRRTGFGPFRIEAAAALDTWTAEQPSSLVALRQALGHLPAIQLNAKMAEAVSQGKAWVLDSLAAQPGETAVLVDGRDDVLAVVVRHGTAWTYARVLSISRLYKNQAVC
jgi:tRNA pseudouridine55 synthase